MRVSAIVQARMGSSRLPGKVMREIGQWPMLAHMLGRVGAADTVDTIVVATPDTPDNEPIWKFIDGSPAKLHKGPTDDVLTRVLQAAKETDTDIIVELTGDCPLLDPKVIDLCVGYLICGKWDIVTNCQKHTWPKGMCVRVFTTDTLAECNESIKGHANEKQFREDVSLAMYDGTLGTSVLNLEAPDEERYPELNLSVDTEEDFRRAKMVIEDIGTGNPLFTVADILGHLAALPGYEMLSAPNLFKEASWDTATS